PGDFAGAGDFPASPLRAEWPPVSVLQVPFDVPKCRGPEGVTGPPEHTGDRVQDSAGSAAHNGGTVPAEILDRRRRPTVECAARRHVAGGTASGRAIRSGTVQTVAAPPAAHAAGTDLFMGGGRPGQRRFRNLDEDGHAVHR